MEMTIAIEGESHARSLPGGGAELAAFCSFAVVRGFGAQHPLIALADRLHEEHGVRMGPLTTFYDATIEDSEDVEKLEMAWQAPGELAEAFAAMYDALAADALAATLLKRAGAEALTGQVETALAIAREANQQGRRIRMSYTL
jgi:hypothetical protein